jgi:hypothetical protein
VVEGVPGGEVAPGLPEHVEILPDMLVGTLDDGQGERAGEGARGENNLW